ncbi:SHOCT domain-containing protein [Marispirochaeta aestuarii]|uniref:SHOCT domain-containing protein n=1 Tax=Marispirochaeta aestuarii TaxID=1963862 RepID=UPI0029C7361E|nr:SHOCT domain-containing protein [Marispirochaeta aestuarii]
MMYGYGNGSCNGFFPFGNFPYGGSISMGIGLVLLIVVAYFLFRNNGPLRSGNDAGRETPLDTLQKRYVNGEISREEYLEKRDILKGGK